MLISVAILLTVQEPKRFIWERRLEISSGRVELPGEQGVPIVEGCVFFSDCIDS